MTTDIERTDRLIPTDEEDYLGALLLTHTRAGAALRDDALTTVTPDQIHDPHISVIWAAARSLLDSGAYISRRAIIGRIDHGTVAAERTFNRLDGTPTPPARHQAAIAEVQRCAKLRAVILAASQIAERARTAEDAEQAITWATDQLAALDHAQAAPEVRAWPELLDEWTAAMDAPPEDGWVIPTPWADINDAIAGGVHGGRMYVIGARPGEGKSIAAHRIAVHAASQGHPALVFSMEMGAFEVTGRMVAGAAEIEMGEISRRALTAHSASRVDRFTARSRDWPIFVVDTPAATVDYIKAMCRAQKRRTGLRVVAVDYLQLVTPDRGKPREQQVAEISRQLKLMSRELDVAVIVPAQLNRGPASRGGRPMLSDLRESGGIEADADVVMLLARQTVSEADDPRLAGTPTDELAVEIAKNRHGPVCSKTLTWRGHFASIC